MVPGIPDFAVLKEIGLARISLGPGFLKKAIQGMKQAAQKLLVHEGMEDITTNPVTGDYLNNLIFKKYGTFPLTATYGDPEYSGISDNRKVPELPLVFDEPELLLPD